MNAPLSPLAQRMLNIITEATKPDDKGSYIEAWTICDQLGVSRGELNCAIPGTKYDKALKELLDAGLIEELPELHQRYRLCKRDEKQLRTSCPQRILDVLNDPDYDLYQEQEGDQEILQKLGEHFRHYDDLLTDIG